MKTINILLLLICLSMTASAADLISEAKQTHGQDGERAAHFLLAHMPQGDRTRLDAAFLFENLDLAFQARQRFT